MRLGIRLLCFIVSLMVTVFSYAAGGKTDAEYLSEMANTELKAENFNKALQLFLQADSAYVAEGQHHTEQYAQALHNTGLAYFNTNNLQKGREYTHKALQLREELFGKMSKKYLESLNNYALSYLLNEELDESLKYYNEIIDLCGKMDTPVPDEGMYLLNTARVYDAMQDEDNAVKYMELALPKVEKFGSYYEYILDYLGNVYIDNNDNVNAYRILELTEEHNNHELTKECNSPECHLERAELYIAKEQSSEAKEEFMAIFELPLTDAQKAVVYRRYAHFLFFNIYDYLQAGEYYSMAAEASISANGETENAANLLLLSGMSYYKGKDYAKALEYETASLSKVEEYGYSKKLKSSILKELGKVHRASKDYPKAIEICSQRIDFLKAYGLVGDADYAQAYENLAFSEKLNADYEPAIEHYNTAIELYENLGMSDEAEETRYSLQTCQIYAHKEYEDVIENENASQQRTQKLREIIQAEITGQKIEGDFISNIAKATSLATIAGSYAMLNDYEKAIDYYSQYINTLRPALMEDFLLKSPKERELTWQHELTNITDMNALIAELPNGTPALYERLSNLIYNGQLLSKGILLSSNIQFDKVLTRYGTSEMKNQYQQIKTNLIEIEKMREEKQPIAEIQTLVRNTEALQLSLSKECASLGLFTDFLKYSIDDVLKSLGSDEAAIEFVTLKTGIVRSDDIIAAVIVSKDYPMGITIPITTIKNCKQMIESPDIYSNDLYTQAIWGNIMPYIPGKQRIYFAPDGLLNNVGIEYMTINGVPMSETFDISRVSSTREICIRHKPKDFSHAYLFGGIDYNNRNSELVNNNTSATTAINNRNAKRESDGALFAELSNTKREVETIYDMLKAYNHKGVYRHFMGGEADKPTFLSIDTQPVSLLHIATHGAYLANDKASEEDAMQQSILALAGANLYDDNDGIISASDIADMSLYDCELVVLSACRTGLGKVTSDGVFGLQRGFKNSGVHSLIVSLNDVADASTADMMIAFYDNYLNKGLSIKDAFKNAQNESREKYPSHNTWASFILIDAI